MHYVDTIGDIEHLNSGIGHHFFDTDTMRFFASRVHEPVISQRFFITSEKRGFDDNKRESHIRMVRNDGRIETLHIDDERATYDTAAKARKALERALEAGTSVRFDLYEMDAATLSGRTEREILRNFYWRAWVGRLGIGSRTDRTDARRMAKEAGEPCPIG